MSELYRYEHAGATDRGVPIKSQIEYPGMSLRDWFAGQAISSIPLRSWDHVGSSDEDRVRAWVRCAYLVADTMIAARKAGE